MRAVTPSRRSGACARVLTTLALGATTALAAFGQEFRAGVDNVLLESGSFARTDDARSLLTLRATPTLSGRIGRDWEWRMGAQLSAVRQSGGSRPYDDQDAELADTWLRWRSTDLKVTAGLQTVLWGRVDEVPLIDRVSRVDASRLLLDNLPQRRRPVPALRVERAFDTLELDVVAMPSFEGAALADPRSVWSPVDQQRGLILGIAPPPALAAFIRTASLRTDDAGAGGLAARLTQTGAGDIDWGLTLARTRQSLPYYVADPVGGTLTATHPYQSFLGGDVEFNAAGATWRSELGATWDARVTTPAGQALKVRATEWVGAVEFFPGGEDLRVNLQVAARKTHVDEETLELRQYAAIGGQIEDTLDQGRWKLALRFNSGLNVHDVYLGPKVTFTGWEPHEISLTYHHFRGEERTLGGFHRDHSLLTLGLRTRF